MGKFSRTPVFLRCGILSQLVVLTGFVSAKMYRPESDEEKDDYTLTLIEYDEQ